MQTLSGGIKITIVTLLAAALEWIMGWHYVFHLLLAAQVLDIVSALVAASTVQEISSDIFGAGWRKKVAAWIAVILVLLLESAYPDTEFPVHIGALTASGMAAVGFIAMEALSIIENVQRCGLQLPPFVVRTLAAAKRDYLSEDK